MIRFRTPPLPEARSDRARATGSRARATTRRAPAPEVVAPREPLSVPSPEPVALVPEVAPASAEPAIPGPVDEPVTDATAPPAAPLPAAPTGRGAWVALPLRGRLAIDYRDAGGARTRRVVSAQELRVGPGKTILGAIDPALDAYRGFRADRIERAYDLEAREGAERDVVDWLLARAERQRRAAAKAARADAARARAAGARTPPSVDEAPTAPSPAA